ncbi:MAG TPA: ORF6N domain-containing protein [Candidatus Udaeobacter sp.]|nr:ORF6N domain-containing protein [Candidatus Udaeobacter sp.]
MANDKAATAEINRLERLIHEVRGQKVMLDADLAGVYGVSTARLNQQVKRNQARFPSDFVFQLTGTEYEALMLQIATSKTGRGGRRKLPYAFTEHGAIMASMVLNTPRAVQMSVYVVRAFAGMRAMLGERREWTSALRSLEKELKQRVNAHEAAIVSILQRLMDLIDPPPLPEPPKREIGFHVKEARSHYVVRRRR